VKSFVYVLEGTAEKSKMQLPKNSKQGCKYIDFDYSSSSSSSNTCHWIANDDTVDRFILIEELFLSEISKVSTSLYKCTVELF